MRVAGVAGIGVDGAAMSVRRGVTRVSVWWFFGYVPD
jgi:hypothetical protein